MLQRNAVLAKNGEAEHHARSSVFETDKLPQVSVKRRS